MAARVCEEVLDRDCLERAAIGYLPTNPDVADYTILFNKPFMLIIGEREPGTHQIPYQRDEP